MLKGPLPSKSDYKKFKISTWIDVIDENNNSKNILHPAKDMLTLLFGMFNL